MCAPRSSQQLTQQAFFLAHQSHCTPADVEVPKDAFDLHLMRARRPSRTQALPSLRVVLTLPCALLLLVSPALAMKLWRPRYP